MKTHLIALTIGTLACSVAGGWELIATDQLIARSDLIIIAKLGYIKRGEPGPQATDVGYLQAQEVLKGNPADGRGAVLTFPGRRGTIGSDGTFRSSLTATDLRFEEGLEACWFLKRKPGSDSFEIDNPVCVQPYPFYDSIRAALARPVTTTPGARRRYQ